jgi:DNA modification methylase
VKTRTVPRNRRAKTRAGSWNYCLCCARTTGGWAILFPTRRRKKSTAHFTPHQADRGLIRKLIGAVTRPGDLVVDPSAGSFVIMHAAHQLGRDFVGCDLAYDSRRISMER